MGRVREEKRRRKNIKKRKSQEKEDPSAQNGGKVAKHCVFLMICGSGGSKSRVAKAAGAEPAGQMRDEQLHDVAARSTFRSQNEQKTLHAVVARSTFRSQHLQSTPGSDHFWKLRCRKSARRFGAKHISKSKDVKSVKQTERFGALFDVQMLFGVAGARKFCMLPKVSQM